VKKNVASARAADCKRQSVRGAQHSPQRE